MPQAYIKQESKNGEMLWVLHLPNGGSIASSSYPQIRWWLQKVRKDGGISLINGPIF